ncbi:hypothetical protein TRFO_03318 [Tritrichomonas foetus]|uniref:LisH domain-containing protein n=1 Tax=Tritrichomonas foetus TaxID=1144522 RepID=A0A1J4KVM2_9EUKA|nr:hypothetical protein TRFO_03318 [Tritrichomonas foetus]|eukprot:OHT13565.1 hypothetical protein TRFO_03318 [Tritrichomonas foetus]
MTKARKGISERAVERLEEKGYLMSIRAEMKAEVMKCLVEMEEQGEIPPHLRIKRYTPTDDGDYQALAFIAEFLRFHGLENSLTCLKAEVNGDIPPMRNGDRQSELAAAIAAKGQESDESDNPLFRH